MTTTNNTAKETKEGFGSISFGFLFFPGRVPPPPPLSSSPPGRLFLFSLLHCKTKTEQEREKREQQEEAEQSKTKERGKEAKKNSAVQQQCCAKSEGNLLIPSLIGTR
jgi:flagellar biosynthesis component FlhA